MVIKGVSDFADGNKSETDQWRPFASVMAASLVAHTIKDSDVFRSWPHFEGKCAAGWIYQGNFVLKKIHRQVIISMTRICCIKTLLNDVTFLALVQTKVAWCDLQWQPILVTSCPQVAWKTRCRSCKKWAKKQMNIKTNTINGNKKASR